MKKILYLHAGAELYGADIVLLELLKKLDKTEFELYVILPTDGPLVQKLKENNINVEVIPYPILRRKYFNIKGIINYFYTYMKYSKKLAQIAKEKQIDIVHTNTYAVLEGIYLKKKLKVKHIWHIHEIIVNPKIVYKFLCKIISKYADRVVVVSDSVKQHLIKSNYYNKVDINIIYNGIDRNKFNADNDTEYLKKEFNIRENDIIVGMIGRVNSWKGQGDFIKAVSPILKKYQNVKAMMVGGVFEGEEWRIEQLKELINKDENSNRILYSNFRKDVPNIHNLFDIFVLPSTNPDPLPTVVLEAMATGKPVVGYRHGGICEMVKENETGLLVEPLNTVELSEKIEELISNEEKRKEYGIKSSSRQKDEFSIESYVSKFEKLYNHV